MKRFKISYNDDLNHDREWSLVNSKYEAFLFDWYNLNLDNFYTFKFNQFCHFSNTTFIYLIAWSLSTQCTLFSILITYNFNHTNGRQLVPLYYHSFLFYTIFTRQELPTYSKIILICFNMINYLVITSLGIFTTRKPILFSIKIIHNTNHKVTYLSKDDINRWYH